MPPELVVTFVMPTPDGRTLLALARPKVSVGSGAPQQQFHVRRLDDYEFKPLEGTEGALFGLPTRDSRGLRFLAPVSAGSPQLQLAFVPLDGSAPATTIAEWEDGWRTWIELPNGDLLIHDEPAMAAHCRADDRLPCSRRIAGGGERTRQQQIVERGEARAVTDEDRPGVAQ